jgi:7-cyano-7-deazaguanine synthase
MTKGSNKKAIILLSGGLDSATVLAHAVSEGFQCHCLSFDYGQSHQTELAHARIMADALGAASHRTAHLDLAVFGGSALTDETIDVPDADLGNEQIPVTYVPARNTVFLAYALAWGEVLPAYDLFIGVNAVDYSGYPDCRPAFIEAFERMANQATKAGVESQAFQIHAPLLHLTKGEIIQKGVKLGVNYEDTVSCYRLTDAGEACGRCDACVLRKDGFIEAGIPDPTRYVR